MNSKEMMEAAEKVVEFAKSLGFDRAEVAIWDHDDPEQPCDSLEEVVDWDREHVGRAQLGVFFHMREPVRFVLHENPADEDEPTLEYLPNAEVTDK